MILFIKKVDAAIRYRMSFFLLDLLFKAAELTAEEKLCRRVLRSSLKAEHEIQKVNRPIDTHFYFSHVILFICKNLFCQKRKFNRIGFIGFDLCISFFSLNYPD